MTDGQPLLVGVDVGTTRVKAGVIGLDGVELTRASVPTVWHRRPTGAEARPEDFVRAVRDALALTLANAPPGEILGVGITSMAETAVLVDQTGHALGPAVAWYDRRADADVERDGAGAHPRGGRSADRPRRRPDPDGRDAALADARPSRAAQRGQGAQRRRVRRSQPRRSDRRRAVAGVEDRGAGDQRPAMVARGDRVGRPARVDVPRLAARGIELGAHPQRDRAGRRRSNDSTGPR